MNYLDLYKGLVPVNSHADITMRGVTIGVAGGVEVPSGGNLVADGATEGNEYQGAWVSNWIAMPFTPSVSGTLASAILRLSRDAGALTSTETLCLYSNTSDAPGIQIGTCSGTINTNDVPTSEGDVSFTGMSAAFVSSIQYWLVLTRSAAEGAQVRWNGLTSPTLTNISSVGASKISTDGTTWGVNTTYRLKFNATY